MKKSYENIYRAFAKELREIVQPVNPFRGELSHDENPFRRTINVLKNDMKRLRTSFRSFFLLDNGATSIGGNSKSLSKNEQTSCLEKNSLYGHTTHCDVLVIGGGVMGSSIAYWLKKKTRDGLNVIVVEKDRSYQKASTVLSVGGLRQQFSLPENIEMSLFGADFIRNVKNELGDDVELNFTPYGYLTLANDEYAETMRRNSRLQNEMGARNEVLTAEKLKLKFPWLNVDGITLGCHGLEKEGWFDPWALLSGFVNRSKEFGAHYVDGEVIEFEFRERSHVISENHIEGRLGSFKILDKATVKLKDGQKHSIKFAICILAAGPNSGKVAKLAGVGVGQGLLAIPLPVNPRRRDVFVISTQGSNAPSLGSPLTIDTDGTYFRCDNLSGNFICGRSPDVDENANIEDVVDLDLQYFDKKVWPSLAKRVNAFESAKVQSGWVGFYEYNDFDENGIVGNHPYYSNLYIASGFSGHGLQQAPAVGRAISEIILDGRYRTIDLTRLGFDRLIVNKPMFESNIV